MRAKAHAQQLADRRFVVDDKHLEGGGAHAARIQLMVLHRDRQPDGEDRARPVGPVRRGDSALERLDEPARDREPEAGAGTHLIAFLDAIELVEDMFQIIRRNADALVHDAQADRRRFAPAVDMNNGSRRRVFGGVVEKIEQHLLEQHRIEFQHRQVRREV